MRPFTVQSRISADRAEVFDFVADLANRPAWCDHYQQDFRLARANAVGNGAAARFKLDLPAGRQWVELATVAVERPRRIAERGRTGRVGRVAVGAEWEFVHSGSGMTRVELTVWTEPRFPIDRLRELAGARPWLRRQTTIALDRLRQVFEERPERPLARATIAGYEPLKAPRFGA